MRHLPTLRNTRSEIAGKLRALDAEAGESNLNRHQQGQWNKLTRELGEIDDLIRQTEAEMARADEIAAHRAKWGSLQVGGTTASPWDGLDVRRESPDGLRRRARDVIDRSEALSEQGRTALSEAVDGDPTAAAIVAARSNPAYENAFAKILANPERGLFTLTPEELASVQSVEQVRASMATTTGTAGYLIPLSLDPNVILSNAGATNPIRTLAQVKQVQASPHRAITSAGITGAWVAEATAIGDKSPAFVGTDVELHKMAMWITGSYEILQDAAKDLATILPPLLADARDRLEADAFTVGSGSGAPFGIVTDLAAASAFVTATTRGTFTSASSGDVLALINAQTPRTRQSGKTAWVANNAILSAVRQQTIGTAGSLLMDLADDGNLLGHPVFEASAMESATTSGNHIAVLADFDKYLICDHVGGPSLEYVQNAVDGDGLPLGVRGWIYWHRVGAKTLDLSAGKVLLA